VPDSIPTRTGDANTCQPPIQHEQAASRQSPPRDAQPGPKPLWDAAYTSVQSDHKGLVDTFEAVLLRIDLDGDLAKLKDAHSSDGANQRARLQEAVRHGLDKTKAWASAAETAGTVTTALQGVSDIIQSTLSAAIPQAGAAWMGVAILLKGFRNAAEQSALSREGVVYVGSQAQWYRELFSIRDALTESNLSKLRGQLEARMTDLFVEIIVYQMESVIRFYKNQLGVALLDSLGLRDCGEALESIRNGEQEIRRCLGEFDRKVELEHLANLTKATTDMGEKTGFQLDEMLKHQDEASAKKEREKRQKHMDYAHKLIGRFKVEGLHYDEFMDRNPSPAQGTCGWFMNDKRVLDWEEGEKDFLLVKAMPGQGKSVLARSLVHQWRARSQGTVCHFFFKDTNTTQRRADRALCAILHQLLKDDWELALKIKADVEKLGSDLTSSVTELWRLFQTVVLETKKGPVICVLDALDECQEDDDHRRLLLDALTAVCKPARGKLDNRLKILATTRPLPTIVVRFSKLPNISLDPSENHGVLADEINVVIEQNVARMASDKGWSSSLRARIEKELKGVGTPQYTYLWLRLVFEILDEELVLPDDDWIDLIRELPQTVNSAYEKLLGNVKPRMKPAVRALLSIILCSTRPLEIREMNVALGVASGTTNVTMAYIDGVDRFKSWINSNCGFFVQIYRDKVQFIHQTGKEFLIEVPAGSVEAEWQGSLGMTVAHGGMRDLCRQYLAEQARGWVETEFEKERMLDAGTNRFLPPPGTMTPSDDLMVYATENIRHHDAYSGKLEIGVTDDGFIIEVTAAGSASTSLVEFHQYDNRRQGHAAASGQRLAYDCLAALKRTYRGDDNGVSREAGAGGPPGWMKIRIPRLYHEDLGGQCPFAAKEYIHGSTLREMQVVCSQEEMENRKEQIAQALALFLCFPAPTPAPKLSDFHDAPAHEQDTEGAQSHDQPAPEWTQRKDFLRKTVVESPDGTHWLDIRNVV